MTNQRSDTLPKFDRWNVIKEIGEGATSKVYLATEKDSNQQVALKVFTFSSSNSLKLSETMNNEVKILRCLKHPNILRVKDYIQPVKCESSESGITDVGVIVLEYAERGELFDLIKESNSLPTEIARTYFKQILRSLQHLHLMGVVHRDIKPENILVDENYNLKLADFGYAARDKDSKFTTPSGTSIYFAPEIHDRRPYSARKADLFATAIILFTMATGHMPFGKADRDDEIYNLIRVGDSDTFWDFHKELSMNECGHADFDDSFKDLVWKMFNPEPDQRPSLSAIFTHDFMKAKELSSLELLAAMKSAN